MIDIALSSLSVIGCIWLLSSLGLMGLFVAADRNDPHVIADDPWELFENEAQFAMWQSSLVQKDAAAQVRHLPPPSRRLPAA